MTPISSPHSAPGILVRSHLMWLRGFMESVAPDAVPKVDMALGRLDELVEQLEAANRALETPRQYDVLLSDMKEQLEALREAVYSAESVETVEEVRRILNDALKGNSYPAKERES